MIALSVAAAAGVICRSMENGESAPAGWAAALDAACMLQTPERAAEIAALQGSLDRRTALLREVQAMARRLRKEADGRKAYGDRLKAENAALVERAGRGHGLLSERTRELVAMEKDRNRWKARVAELEAQLTAKDRPVDEDPIAFTLTNRAVVPAGFCRNESPYGRLCDLTAGHDGDHAMADGAGGHFGWPASDDDVRTQVRKLRNLLGGQRDAVAEAGERP